jgi:hypothetical protein
MTIIFILVDDWYKAHGIQYLKGKPGAKPNFSDSEVITLFLAIDFIPFPSEIQFLGFIRANCLSLFPRLIDQSQFNRRARVLHLLVEELRRTWLVQHEIFRLQTGCPHQLEWHSSGLWTGSSSHRRAEAAEAVLIYLRGCQIFGDKGFIGADWQARVFAWTQNQILTPKRSNQYQQNPKAIDRWLNSVRERIEGVFHELTNTGRDLEGLLAKTRVGLCTRVIAKMASYVLKCVLKIQFGIKVQTFEMAASAA